MAARANITDRGFRYRAVRRIPNHAKVCAFCGKKNGLEVGHVDGDESNDAPENLTWTCRPCNVLAGNTLRSAGVGRLTHQYNPSKSGGASNVGEWIQAVGAITPRDDRGDRGLSSTMDVADAVAMIRATPHSKRSQFAAQLGKHKGARRNMWPFDSGMKRGAVPAHGGLAKFGAGRRQESPKAASPDRAAGSHKGYKISKTADGEFYSSLDPESWYETAAQVRRAIDSYVKGRSNPSHDLIREAQTSRNIEELSRLHKYALKMGNEALKVAVELRAADLGFRHEQLTDRYGWKLNPARFERCVKAVKEHGGAANAYAVCTAAGTRNPVTIVPLGLYDVQQLDAAGRGIFKSLKGGKKRGNPGEIHESESVERSYELFHGRPASETVYEDKDVYLGPSKMWSVGDLIKLVVLLDNGDTITLKNFKDSEGRACHLSANRAGTQLYVRKGDQAVDLEEFGIGEPYHDKEYLGEVETIWYFTTKDHLGDEGGEANYYHRLGEEHALRPVKKSYEFGKIKTRRVPRPRLVYDTKNQELEFVGGEYIIEVEGIRN